MSALTQPCIASSKGGDIEYYFGVWATKMGARFTKQDFEIVRDTVTLYLKVLGHYIESDDIWEGEPH